MTILLMAYAFFAGLFVGACGVLLLANWSVR